MGEASTSPKPFIYCVRETASVEIFRLVKKTLKLTPYRRSKLTPPSVGTTHL